LTWSTLIFSPGVLHEAVFRMFVQLRTAIKYYCVAQPVGTTHSTTAASALLQYAQLAESYVTAGLLGSTMPPKLLSFNLHILNCRLKDQEKARGHVAYENELWIERSIQEVRSAPSTDL
jgi:hypothetical protein